MVPSQGQPPGPTGDVAYLLPRHRAEIDRLDVQHHALREMRRANYSAALQRPALILDVGTGSGQWAYELAEEFPHALVIGVDLVPSKPGAPRNYRDVRANVLQGLPFEDGRFDFVHQRLLFSGVPVRLWPAEVQDLVRTLRPGGWVELVEGATEFPPPTPAMERLTEMLRKLNRTRGLDSTSVVYRSLDSYLTRAGVVDVRRQTVTLPIGEWGGRIGSLMASDIRALFTRLCGTFSKAYSVSDEECHKLIRDAQEEWEGNQTTYSLAVAYGRKPTL